MSKKKQMIEFKCGYYPENWPFRTQTTGLIPIAVTGECMRIILCNLKFKIAFLVLNEEGRQK